jgi:hypothetical protein
LFRGLGGVELELGEFAAAIEWSERDRNERDVPRRGATGGVHQIPAL